MYAERIDTQRQCGMENANRSFKELIYHVLDLRYSQPSCWKFKSSRVVTLCRWAKSQKL